MGTNRPALCAPEKRRFLEEVFCFCSPRQPRCADVLTRGFICQEEALWGCSPRPAVLYIRLFSQRRRFISIAEQRICPHNPLCVSSVGGWRRKWQWRRLAVGTMLSDCSCVRHRSPVEGFPPFPLLNGKTLWGKYTFSSGFLCGLCSHTTFGKAVGDMQHGAFHLLRTVWQLTFN